MLFLCQVAVNHVRNEARQQALPSRLRASEVKCTPPLWSVKIRPTKARTATHAMHDEIRTYAELQQQMQYALREQHPEWMEPNGDSPICHSYERRFTELLALFAKSGTSSARTLNG